MGSEPSDAQIPPPKDWEAFERRMRDLFEAHWRSPAEMHGRTGQRQCGVDIYGRPGGGKEYHGVQCKLHGTGRNAGLTEKELRAEARKAGKFKPKIEHFILATTGPRDAAIQQVARQPTTTPGAAFSVQVMFWDDILNLYDQHAAVFAQHYPHLAPRKPAVPHQLRAPAADFTGRQKELDALLSGVRASANISGMQGMGGVGKTELALVVAHQLLDRYPDAQFFLELKGTSDEPLSTADALSRVIQGIQPNVKLPEDLAALRGAYLSVLHDKRAIILADDAASAEQVRPLLPPASCLLLVTSRRYFVVEGLVPVRLDCLPEDDAVKLLLKICPRIGGSAATIAHACGYLPLALRAAGSFLAVRPDVPVEQYVGDLGDEQRRLETIGTEGVPIGVEASLMLTYRQLDAATARVLRLLSVFPGTFAAEAQEVVCQDEAHRRLGELLRFSLVEYDETAQRYRLHDLVRLLAGWRLDEPANAADRLPAQGRHARHYAAVLAAADELYLKGGDEILKGLALFDRERHNIEAGQAWAAGRADPDETAARLASDYPDAGTYVLSLRLHSRRWMQWLGAAVAAARHLKDRGAEGTHLGNLGNAYADLGDARRAIEYHEQALAIHREIGDRHGEGADLGNLGIAYAALGDARRAIEYDEQALAIHREIGDRRGEGTALGTLGSAYYRLGKFSRAIEYHEQALAIDREIGDRLGQGADLGNLGNAYADLGNVPRAIEYYKQVLAIDREIGDRRGEGNGLGNLGLAYADLGEVHRAIEYYEQALGIHREIGDRRGEGNALWNWALALVKLDHKTEAIPLAEQALAIYRQIEDPNAARVERALALWRAEASARDEPRRPATQ